MNEPSNNEQPKASADMMVPADHPALAGHFPGNPIVPGVVILEMVRQFVESEYPPAVLNRISQAKFNTPLRPGQAMRVETIRAGNTIRFSCIHVADIVASGEMVFGFEE